MDKLFVTTLVIFFLQTPLQSQVLAGEWHEFYSNARANAMGNASLAVTNDETALILNPAALGRLRDQYGTLFDPEYETNSNALNVYKIAGIGNNFTVQKAKDTTDTYRDTYYHHRGQIFPSYVRKYFGLGVLYRNHLDAQMNTTGTNLDLNYRNDIALVGGLSLRLFDGRIKLGVNGKIISRIEVQNSAVDPAGNLDMTTIGATEGMGLSSDAGILLTGPWTWLPTLGAVVRDIGGTTFDKRTGVRGTFASTPAKVEQTVDVAMAVFPIHSNTWRSAWTLEYKDVTMARAERDSTRRMHFGFEYNWADIFFIRGGYNQRYWTGGIELASEYVQWQLSTYGEEIGTDASPQEDRRYAVKFAFRF